MSKHFLYISIGSRYPKWITSKRNDILKALEKLKKK